MRLSIADFRKVVQRGGVLVDVRSPGEFAQGHIPGAMNLPLFTDEERAVVGTLYKQRGKAVAVEKGLEFVGVKMAQMVRQVRKWTREELPVCLYCWRGGMRSGSVGWLLQTAGFETYVLEGGYKQYRSEFRDILVDLDWEFIVLGGFTGSGKTEILQQMKELGEQVVDLEDLANHRGSAFGSYGQPEQPTTEMFINLLHEEMLKMDPSQRVWMEGESRSIGRVFLPPEFVERMDQSTFVMLEIPFDVRLSRSCKEYGQFPKELLIDAIERISKRLGYDRAKEAIQSIESGDIRSAAALVLRYYDNGYANAIGKHNYPRNIRCFTEVDTPLESAKMIVQTVNSQK